VEPSVQSAELLKAARGADRTLISDAQVFDVFKLPDGKVSLAVSVTLQPKDKTLTEEEIEAVSVKIIAMVGKATGAVLRG
jgi:phenylalanyl-tRNA synthetase beta chain